MVHASEGGRWAGTVDDLLKIFSYKSVIRTKFHRKFRLRLFSRTWLRNIDAASNSIANASPTRVPISFSLAIVPFDVHLLPDFFHMPPEFLVVGR